MSDIRIDSEKELIEELLKSKVYKEFTQEQLQPKIERELRAWKLLVQNRGKYTYDINIDRKGSYRIAGSHGKSWVSGKMFLW